MFATTFLKSSAASTVIVLLIAAGAAFADHDGKGGDRGGGDRGGGDRSFSGGSDRSGGSIRSFNQGSDRSSSRSMSRASDNDDNRSTFRSNPGSIQFKSNQSGSQFKQGSQNYQTRRPSGDQVGDFLKLKDGDNGNNAARFRDRSPQDKAVVDREFNQWRNTWNGDTTNKGDKVGNTKVGHDHRDWSGNWMNSDRFTTADHIRNDWRNRKDKDFVFSDNWWKNKHHGNSWVFWGDYAFRNRHPYYWWNWANGPRLGSWFVFGWPTPYYWDYGPGEYLYCDNGAVYVNGRWYEPQPIFYDQTVRLIDQGPNLTADAAAQLDWLPLGVFAVTPDGLNEPMVMVQLAVTKDGVIGGTAFDQKSGASFNIQGTVDKRSQRAVWSYTNDRNNRVMMETSIYNLTQPEATGLVHYGPTDSRVVELVRLQDPSSGTAAQGTVPSTLPAPPAAR